MSFAVVPHAGEYLLGLLKLALQDRHNNPELYRCNSQFCAVDQ